MNRKIRTVIVVGLAVALAALASFGVYRAVERIPVREVPVAHHYAVVAQRDLPVGTLLTAQDLKLVAWPDSDPIAGGFSETDPIVDRGLIVSVLENEPIAENKLAPIEAGAGLTPTIPAGMRAVSVKVNEVIGVAGFTVPGTRVDVVATVNRNQDSMTRTVVSNVMVLTAGTKYDQEQARQDGEPIKSTVVTLALTPSDAERVILAAAEGRIILALRNPLDLEHAETQGVKLANLMAGADPPPVVRVVQGRPKVVSAPPPAPKIYTVEAIRAAERSEETVR
jgi:pilus assembly protein CpaB